MKKKLTSFGSPVDDDQNSMTAGVYGTALLKDSARKTVNKIKQ
jgi:catalase